VAISGKRPAAEFCKRLKHDWIFDLHGCTGCTGFFSGNGWLSIPGIRKCAWDHRSSWLLVQETLVPLLLCILYIDVEWIVRLDRPAAWRTGLPHSRGASSHDLVTPRDNIAQTFGCRSSLKQVHRSSCLFVLSCGSSPLPAGRFSSVCSAKHGGEGIRV